MSIDTKGVFASLPQVHRPVWLSKTLPNRKYGRKRIEDAASFQRSRTVWGLGGRHPTRNSPADTRDIGGTFTFSFPDVPDVSALPTRSPSSHIPASTSAVNKRRCTVSSNSNSGCHCTPTMKRAVGTSTASTTPSGACATMRNGAATLCTA